jgi:hypothetical protein
LLSKKLKRLAIILLAAARFIFYFAFPAGRRKKGSFKGHPAEVQ